MPKPQKTAAARLQRIPVIRDPVNDLEALEHARICTQICANQLEDTGLPPHQHTSRALSELDRLIDHARRQRS